MAELKRYDYAIQNLLRSLALYGWQCVLGRKPVAGDLVMLQSAPPSVWHLSFYLEDMGDGYHLVESLKTGEKCRWGNVGFIVLDREKTGLYECVEWSDAQFALEAKFEKACRRGDFFLNIPYISGWDGECVLFTMRTRYSFDELRTELAPLPWKKVTLKALLAHLEAGAKEHASRREAQRAPAEAAHG